MMLSIIVPFRADGAERTWNWAWCKARWQALFPDAELIEADSGDEAFNPGKSRNQAARKATGDIFLLADADGANDNIVRSMFMLGAGAPWVVAYSAPAGYIALTQEATQTRTIAFEPQSALYDPVPYEWYERCHAYSGALLCRAEDFWKVGGYDERFEGFGYEDNAFQEAMDCLIGPHERPDGFHLHLWHPHVESERFNQPHILRNKALADEYTACRGNPKAMEALIRRTR